MAEADGVEPSRRYSRSTVFKTGTIANWFALPINKTMFTAIVLSLALTVEELPLSTLEKYYWDCDTLFMKGEMGGQDILSCLAVTDQFILKKFKNNRKKFRQYWESNKHHEWETRGFVPEQV